MTLKCSPQILCAEKCWDWNWNLVKRSQAKSDPTELFFIHKQLLLRLSRGPTLRHFVPFNKPIIDIHIKNHNINWFTLLHRIRINSIGLVSTEESYAIAPFWIVCICWNNQRRCCFMGSINLWEMQRKNANLQLNCSIVIVAWDVIKCYIFETLSTFEC